jgi:hypothetical protein
LSTYLLGDSLWGPSTRETNAGRASCHDTHIRQAERAATPALLREEAVMDPFGVEFGKTIGQLVTEYRTTFAWVALVWHVSTLFAYIMFSEVRLNGVLGSS